MELKLSLNCCWLYILIHKVHLGRNSERKGVGGKTIIEKVPRLAVYFKQNLTWHFLVGEYQIWKDCFWLQPLPCVQAGHLNRSRIEQLHSFPFSTQSNYKWKPCFMYIFSHIKTFTSQRNATIQTQVIMKWIHQICLHVACSTPKLKL